MPRLSGLAGRLRARLERPEFQITSSNPDQSPSEPTRMAEDAVLDEGQRSAIVSAPLARKRLERVGPMKITLAASDFTKCGTAASTLRTAPIRSTSKFAFQAILVCSAVIQ